MKQIHILRWSALKQIALAVKIVILNVVLFNLSRPTYINSIRAMIKSNTFCYGLGHHAENEWLGALQTRKQINVRSMLFQSLRQ